MIDLLERASVALFVIFVFALWALTVTAGLKHTKRMNLAFQRLEEHVKPWSHVYLYTFVPPPTPPTARARIPHIEHALEQLTPTWHGIILLQRSPDVHHLHAITPVEYSLSAMAALLPHYAISAQHTHEKTLILGYVRTLCHNWQPSGGTTRDYTISYRPRSVNN